MRTYLQEKIREYDCFEDFVMDYSDEICNHDEHEIFVSVTVWFFNVSEESVEKEIESWQMARADVTRERDSERQQMGITF